MIKNLASSNISEKSLNCKSGEISDSTESSVSRIATKANKTSKGISGITNNIGKKSVTKTNTNVSSFSSQKTIVKEKSGFSPVPLISNHFPLSISFKSVTTWSISTNPQANLDQN